MNLDVTTINLIRDFCGLIIFVGLLLLFPYVLFRGVAHKKAREYLNSAVLELNKSNYVKARQFLDVVKNLNRPLYKSIDITSLQSVVNRQAVQEIQQEISKIQIAAGKFPRSRYEVLIENSIFKVIVILLVFLIILSRLGLF